MHSVLYVRMRWALPHPSTLSLILRLKIKLQLKKLNLSILIQPWASHLQQICFFSVLIYTCLTFTVFLSFFFFQSTATEKWFFRNLNANSRRQKWAVLSGWVHTHWWSLKNTHTLKQFVFEMNNLCHMNVVGWTLLNVRAACRENTVKHFPSVCQSLF